MESAHKTAIHDCNLRVDDKLIHLGPSSKGAGKKPAHISLGDVTAGAHEAIDRIIDTGIVVVAT